MQMNLMALQKVGRHIKLPPRAVSRKGAQDTGNT